MKKTRLLKTILNIIYYLNIVFVVILPIAITIILVKVNTDGLVYDGKKYTHVGINFVVMLILRYGLFLVLLHCLVLFRKIISFFIESSFFHKDVIVLFNAIGKRLILVSIGFTLISIVPIHYSYTTFRPNGFTNYNNSDFEFSINLIWIGVGLFFLVLSEVFNNAKKIKQENDLTI